MSGFSANATISSLLLPVDYTNSNEDKGFYPVLEGIYNNNPQLRVAVEASCKERFNKLPMVANVDNYQLVQLMVQYLEKYSPEFLPFFSCYKERLPANSGEMIRRKLSPGVSLRLAPLPLLLQKGIDQCNLSYAANYAAPNGQATAIDSLVALEGSLLGDIEAYSADGVYITEGGATNGIYTALAFICALRPFSEVLVCGPGYFQFYYGNMRGAVKSIINPKAQENGDTEFLPSAEMIERAISDDSIAIIITQPNNPTGEFYSRGELGNIVQLAIDHNLLIIEDAAFEELVFPEERSSFCSVAKIAYERAALDRVITIKSFSKGKNLPGERLGYLATTNQCFIDFMQTNLLAQRDCPSNMNTGMICLDSVLRYVESQLQVNPCASMQQTIDSAMQFFEEPLKSVTLPINNELCLIYIMQRIADMAAYCGSYDALSTLRNTTGLIVAATQKKSAYNTFVKLKELPNDLSIFEYAINLFLEYGIETQWGPNFFEDPRKWQQLYGNWLRITFSSDKEYLQDSLWRLAQSYDDFKKSTRLFRTALFK